MEDFSKKYKKKMWTIRVVHLAAKKIGIVGFIFQFTRRHPIKVVVESPQLT